MLSALGSLWINGATVDWNAFPYNQKLRRIPLPTYPFQRKKLWIGPKIGTNWLADSLGNVDDWFYRSHWKSAPLDGGVATTGPCLVLADDTPASAKLIGELRRSGGTIITVSAGENSPHPETTPTS